MLRKVLTRAFLWWRIYVEVIIKRTLLNENILSINLVHVKIFEFSFI